MSEFDLYDTCKHCSSKGVGCGRTGMCLLVFEHKKFQEERRVLLEAIGVDDPSQIEEVRKVEGV